MRIFHAILPGSLPRATIKQQGNILSLFSAQAFRAVQTCPVFLFSLPHWLAAGQASQHDRAHILSLCFLAAGRTSQHERPHSLFFTDSVSHIRVICYASWDLIQFMDLDVWEIILSSFIFPSKPTDPWRNKLDIFNSCFNFGILIPVLMTAFQFLL